MTVYDYEEAFGTKDVTTGAMKKARNRWLDLYYGTGSQGGDPCQRIAYTVVCKLVKTIFGEYQASCPDPAAAEILRELNPLRKEAMQQTLTQGECYLKPCVEQGKITFALVPRSNLLIFGRNRYGEPTDLGMAERTATGAGYDTLLERRQLDQYGNLTITNRLFRSLRADQLGREISLREHPGYENLSARFRYEKPLGSTGLVRLKTPILNCVDGSSDGVAVFAAAEQLIRNIDRNEEQMNGEFERGESRIITSADLLRDGQLQDHLFVGLDEDPEQVGITVFNPTLREQSFLARKREYLRNVESIVGLKRGMLSDANIEKWTATEVSSSSGDYNLTVIDFQSIWEQGIKQAMTLCRDLLDLYGLPRMENDQVLLDWGNGTLYDEEKQWQDYKDMVERGLIQPEVALGWRFQMPCETEQEKQQIRDRFMPEHG